MDNQLMSKAAKIKLLVFDIDGTTYRNDIHANPPSTLQALYQLKEQGYRLAICTSRNRDEMVHLSSAYLDMMDVIATVAGGMICWDGQVENNFIAEKDVKAGLAYLDSIQAVYRWSDGFGHGFLNRHEAARDGIFFRLYQMIPELKAYDGRPLNHILYYDTNKRQADTEAKVFKHSQLVQFAPCNEVTAAGIDKAQAIVRIAQICGVTVEQTAVFGDGGNDIGMMRKAGLAVAMGNGCDSCRKAADYVTDRIEADGMYKACQSLGWLKVK